MTIRFSPPERRSNAMAAITAALTGAAGAYTLNPFSTAAQTANLWKALQGEETSKPENLAWVWLSETITRATTDYIGIVAQDHLLTPGARDGAVAKFLDLAIPHEVAAVFNETALRCPASHPAFQPARDAAIALILGLTPIVSFDAKTNQKERYQRAFDCCLNRASAYVFSSAYDRLKPLEVSVTGPAGEPTRREAAWARHYDWIHRKVDTEPVFSPDGSVTVPLKPLYLRPRCFWHEQLPEEDDTGNKPRYRAHLADLHGTAADWLEADDRYRLRLIAGGPGSGKSSFARMFASETILQGRHRVIFVELQHMRTMTGDLRRDLGTYLMARCGSALNGGSAGFPEDAVRWIKDDGHPALLIFDGLDELSFVAENAADLTRNFILSVQQLLTTLKEDGTNVRAMVLGRNLAIQSGMRAAHLPLDLMLNVAPIRNLNKDDLRLPSFETDRDATDKCTFPDLSNLEYSLTRDQRPDYWKNWTRAQGVEAPLPEAITHNDLNDLNVEPLLLHLLILSDFCGNRWHEAVDNRNLVYEDILRKIQLRNSSKSNPAFSWSELQFFHLMEALGLAAWRGNGRAGTAAAFEDVRKLHAHHLFRRTTAPTSPHDLRSVVLQTHARPTDGPEPGFEFIHKSFGEYLTARGLVTAALRLDTRFKADDNEDYEQRLALDWARLVRSAALSAEVIRFLYDEARRRRAPLNPNSVKETLQRILNWAQVHGFPVQQLDGASDFQELERCQRCAEAAMLGVASALAMGNEGKCVDLQAYRDGPIRFLERLHATNAGGNRLLLAKLNLSGADLSGADLSGARLSGADLSGADLSEARLSGADLSGADLSRADLSGARLSGADLSGADLSGVRLSGPELSGADLSGANLSGANLSAANLAGAPLSGADLSEANLSRARLPGANLSRANLSEANLAGADLERARFSGADLSRANLAGADLERADLSEANLSRANLSRANLERADLSEADLSRANLSRANLERADLSRANLSRANLSEADLSRADLSRANLSGALLARSNLWRADLSRANLSSADLADCKFAATSARSADFRLTNLHAPQVNSIFGVRQGSGLTRLPNGIDPPDFWHVEEEGEDDTLAFLAAFSTALAAWRETQ